MTRGRGTHGRPLLRLDRTSTTSRSRDRASERQNANARAMAMAISSASSSSSSTSLVVRSSHARDERARVRVSRVRTRARALAAAARVETDKGPYEARNEFVIANRDRDVVARFEREMAKRQTLATSLGCERCALVKMSETEYAFEQRWGTKEAYEAYMNHPERRRSHLTVGVWQRLPKDKWSVPDNFTPITKG